MTTTQTHRSLFFAVSLFAPAVLAASEFHSGPDQIHLIELYTSEGCSSCPPAERWLSSLSQEAGLWREFVPVAFHVSYWDKLGWRDTYASKDATQRQYAYAASWSANSVYTPCFVLDGREWRPSGRPPSLSKAAKPGVLAATWEQGICRLQFTPDSEGHDRWDGSIALLGSGLKSRVTAGENAGETLVHEFTVLRFARVHLDRGREAAWTGSVALTLPAVEPGERTALAVWVTRRDQLESVQAAGGWLDPAEK
jgi:hypothetical protein